MNFNLAKTASLALALSCCVALTACGEKTDSSSQGASSEAPPTATPAPTAVIASFGPASDFDYLNFTADMNLTTDGMWEGITASDYVTLPADFATVTVPTEQVTPSDASIQAQIDQILQSYATTESITDRAAQDGDTVIIDYAGSVGGVAFAGGTATAQTLSLGSGKFIAGFEEAIVGHNVGESFDITVTFPEGYNDSTDPDGNPMVLSGAEATFAIKLTEIQTTVVPELTNDWVKNNLYATAGFTSVNDLTQAITSELFQQNINFYIWDYIVKNSEISQLPAVILNYNVCQFLSYYDALAYQYGVELDVLVTDLIGLGSVDEFLAMQEAMIVEYANLALLQQAVAEKLDLKVTDELLDTYSDYAETNPEGYIAYNALINLVDETLSSGAIMS